MNGHKYGVRYHMRPVGARNMSTFMDTTPPDAPTTYDKTNGNPQFQMLGNGPDPTLTVNHGNPVGDCGFVMTVNDEYINACETGESFTMPPANEVVSDYLRYNHGVDRGVVNAQLFNYWHTVGLPWAGRLVGAAGVNHQDWDESWAYMYAFGGGCIAVAVTEAMEEQSARGDAWDITGTAADYNVLGGHDVYVFARQDADTGVLATWGKPQLFTRRWWLNYVQELDVTVTDRQVERRGNGYGVDLAQLEAYADHLAAA